MPLKMKRYRLIPIYLIIFLVYHVAKAQGLQLTASYGPGIETGGKMVNDAHGNVYIFGTFTDSIKLSNTIYATASGNFDCYIAKFNHFMQPQWVKTIGTSGVEGAGAIAYYDGRIFLGGWYGAQTTINNDTLFYNLTCISPGFIASMDTSGNFIHAQSFTKDNSISCFVNALEVNKTGLVIAGRLKGQFDFGNNHYLNTYLSGNEHDIFTARFDTAFTCTMAIKANSSLGIQNGDDGATALQLDTLGNIYVGGYFGAISSLSNATLYFGTQTLTAVGGYGFSDFFIAKIRPNGAMAWLRGSGGTLPDFVYKLCLENDSRIALAGRYSDNSTIAGIALPASPADYSSFVGAIDSAGTGISAFRISNESTFQSLKKGYDNYLYAADINTTSPSSRFKIYKIQTDTGIIAIDSLTILQAGNYNAGDIIPPANSCNELRINAGFNMLVKYNNDTVIEQNYQQNLYDFFYGKFSFDTDLLLTAPEITSLTDTVYCSNTDTIHLSVSMVNNASQYFWSILPANAGTVSSNGINAGLALDALYDGPLSISCYAANFCNNSPTSPPLHLTIHAAPTVNAIAAIASNQVEATVINQSNFNWYLDGVPLPYPNSTIINCQGIGSYSVVANNAFCSDSLAEFISCVITAATEKTGSTIKIYPNPAKAMLYIESAGNEPNYIKVYDYTGKVLQESTVSGKVSSLNLNELNSGCYFITIQSHNSYFSSKIIIE